jgi:hypothetical protein
MKAEPGNITTLLQVNRRHRMIINKIKPSMAVFGTRSMSSGLLRALSSEPSSFSNVKIDDKDSWICSRDQ